MGITTIDPRLSGIGVVVFLANPFGLDVKSRLVINTFNEQFWFFLLPFLECSDRAKLQEVANREPLALIEYWAVDPDYDGRVFRSVWQDYRGNTANDADALRVVTQAVLTVAAKPGPRTVCVRVVDLFGFEAEVVAVVAAVAAV